MGIYFNPGNEAFRKDAKSEIYIDKTGLINVTNKLLNEEKNCISVSHARRFGKSQAARMLKSYYSRGCDSKELFSNLEISSINSLNIDTHKTKTKGKIAVIDVNGDIAGILCKIAINKK